MVVYSTMGFEPFTSVNAIIVCIVHAVFCELPYDVWVVAVWCIGGGIVV